MSVAFTWGTTAAERALAFPGDRDDDAACDLLWRGIDVAAPPAVVFRWLCQLRAAPYSYDWIDNRGRRSPRTLTPGLEALARGQRFMAIFALADFAPGEHVTLATPDGSRGARLFGRVSVTYWCRPSPDGRATRLLVKLRVEPAPGLHGALVRRILPWGDLVMMRKQLRTLRALAEATVRSGGSVPDRRGLRGDVS